MTLGTRLAPQHNDGLQNILQRGKQTSSWRDDEIQERVKIPVDERLGGCRGFKSHRPHHISLTRELRIQQRYWPHLAGTRDSPAHFSTKIISETQCESKST